MPIFDCKKIIDAVYMYVRDVYITNFYSKNVKSKTVTENQDVNESLKKTKTVEPISETDIGLKESATDFSETVISSVERLSEDDLKLEIMFKIEDKFNYALAAVCSDLATLDKMYREKMGYDEQPEFSHYFLSISDEFPLCERFVFPCVMFVSSMVVLDVDEKQSDKFYEKYAYSMAQIISKFPTEQGPIVEKYPY